MTIITHAAIRYNYHVYSLAKPARHADIIRHIKQINKVGIDGADIKGFLTNEMKFVNRTQAFAIAKEAGQLLNPLACKSELLFTEDMW
jgi:hypothetical protein